MAVGTGDRESVMAVLAEDVEYMAAGDGKVLPRCADQDRIGWLYHCIARRFVGLNYRLIQVNGALGAVCTMDGDLFSILWFVTDGEHISRVYVNRNPNKLAGVA